MDNIYLIGSRATGKSSISMNRTVIHMDDVLVERIGPIDQFVVKNGWESFRKEETKLLVEISKKTNLLVDCGGGVILSKKNRDIIDKTGIAIWMQANVETIFGRLSKEKTSHRPPLTNKGLFEEIESTLKEREELYKQVADFEVNTNDISLSEVSQAVIFLIEGIKKIAVGVVEKTVEETLAKIKQIQPKIGLMELRIDPIADLDKSALRKIMDNIHVPVIVTNRTKKEGGNFVGSEQERLSLLGYAIQFGADYVDLEFICGKQTFDHFNSIKNQTKLICSFHDFEKLPSNIETIYEQMKKMHPDILKIACMGNSYEDNLKMFDLMTKEDTEMIGIVMGPYGKISRILSPFFSTTIYTYAPLEKTDAFAPGQCTLKEILSLRP